MASSLDRKVPVPLFDTRSPLAPLRGELDAGLRRILDSQSFILGPEVTAFERSSPPTAGWSMQSASPTARTR